MTRNLRVCLAQINTTVGDFTANRDKVVEAIAQARKKKASLIVFPELTLTGYPPEDLLLKSEFVEAGAKTLRSLLPHTKNIMAVVGFAEAAGKALYNTAAILANGKIVAKYRKMYLPNYGVFDERRYFLPGEKSLVLDINGFRLGVSICEDIWIKDGFLYSPAYSGSVSALLNISASPYQRGKQRERELLIKGLAKKAKTSVLYLNLVGGQDELVFDGSSMAVSEKGDILAHARPFEEELLFVDLPVKNFSTPAKSEKNVHVVRAGMDFFKAGDLPEKINKSGKPVLSSEEEVYRALLLGTRDYVEKNGFKKVLIGLSGGIDSALVACVASDALGPENVIGVTMPSRFTSKETYADAKALAKNLGIECLEFGIQELFSTYLEMLKKVFSKTKENCAEENLQARIRGNILMALSNKFGHLVLTTGNKSEMATGYCTLYGDMAGGFAVIKDVPKTLVYKLSVYRNGLRPKNVIPAGILRRPPTAELRFNQKDRDTLPPYGALDRFLEHYVEGDLSIAQTVAKGISPKIARQAAQLVDRNEYKRRQSPPGIKITPKAFGRDRRMPITSRYAP